VADAGSREVVVYRPDGAEVGRWSPTDVTTPEGVTVDNGDLWLVDRATRRVVRYAGGAVRRSGTAAGTASFPLAAENTSPSDLVTDGATVWVTDDGASEVFVYDTAGTALGRWKLDGDNAAPSGITRDPSGGTDLWVVDRVARVVFAYGSGTSLRAGQAAAGGTFRLSPGNTAPEGIADPPVLQVPGFSLAKVATVPGGAAALEYVPDGFGYAPGLYVASIGGDYEDGGPDKLYRVTPAGDLQLVTELPAESDPVYLQFNPGGGGYPAGLYMTAANRDGGRPGDQGGTLQIVDPAGQVRDFTGVGLPHLDQPGAAAFAPAGRYGGKLYVTNLAGNPGPLVAVGADGGTAAFVAPGQAYIAGAAFGPGGRFGDDLFVGTDVGVRRVSPSGEVSPPVLADDGLPASLVFTSGSSFGEFLYYLRSADGTLFRLDPNGSKAAFLTGIVPAKLDGRSGYGSDETAFEPVGQAMYVADFFTGDVYKVTGATPPRIELDPVPDDGRVAADSTVLLTGRAFVDTPGAVITHVTVNGVPVDELDAAGNFFARVRSWNDVRA
jgi:sugar lactone lactonase YvrE